MQDTKDVTVWVQFGDTQMGLPESLWTYHSPIVKELIADARKRLQTEKKAVDRIVVSVSGVLSQMDRHDPQAFMKLEPLLRLIGTTKRGIPASKPLRSHKLEEVFQTNLNTQNTNQNNHQPEPDIQLISLLRDLFPFVWDTTKMPNDNWDRFHQTTLICSTMTIATDLKMNGIMQLLGAYYATFMKIHFASTSSSSSGSSSVSSVSSTPQTSTPNTNSTSAPMDICK